MRLYNTLTRSEEEFAPSQDNIVRMYTCGLTVYARGHIGNFRTFVSLDVLRRALRHQEGFAMRHVMNFTDVDDRTIQASEQAGVPLEQHGIHFPFMWSAAEQRVRFLTSFPFPVTMWERLAQCGVRCVVLDAYESMTVGRPYRSSMSHEEALKELLRCSGSQFDPRVVQAFAQLFETQSDMKSVRTKEAA